MWFFSLLIGVALDVVAALIAPKPKKPPVPDPVIPSTTSGAAIPVIFGSITVRDPVFLWYGDAKVSKVTVNTKK